MKIDNVILNIGNRAIPITNIELIITDNSFTKTISCLLVPTDHRNKNPNVKMPISFLRFKPIILWSGNEYDTIGNWTQTQAEGRVLELLGPNLQDGLSNLLPVRHNTTKES